MTDPADESLDALVRRTDPDRWMASRFVADPVRRDEVVALYAFNVELSKIAGQISQPLLGEIRLAWWREGLDEIEALRPVRGHPVLHALEAAHARAPLDRGLLDLMLDTRLRDLEPAPLADEAEVYAYLDGTAVALAAAAARRLATDVDPHAVQAAARAFGVAGLARLGRLPVGWTRAEIAGRVEAAREAANRDLAGLPVEAFAAVAYAALAPVYARGREPGPLARRLRLLGAVATGRV